MVQLCFSLAEADMAPMVVTASKEYPSDEGPS